MRFQLTILESVRAVLQLRYTLRVGTAGKAYGTRLWDQAFGGTRGHSTRKS